MAAGAAVVMLRQAGERAARDAAYDLVDVPALEDATALADALPAFGREVFPHSVVPGGVYSPRELARAIERDAVVAAHYDKVEPKKMRVETVTAPRQMYVSYRKNDRIYWTKKPVTVAAGEQVLTDGTTTIRARCGNCLSEVPMSPTLDDEPAAEEFDRAMDADALPGSLPWQGAGFPGTPVSAPALSSSNIPGAGPGAFPSGGVPAMGGGGGGGGAAASGGTSSRRGASPLVSGGAVNDDPSDAVPPATGATPSNPSGNDVTPPAPGGSAAPGGPGGPGGGFVPPLVPPGGGPLFDPGSPLLPPPNGPLVEIESPLVPPLGPPGGSDPSGPGPGPGQEPGSDEPTVQVQQPVPVPEPTSLTLFGTGAAYMALRRFRARKGRTRD